MNISVFSYLMQLSIPGIIGFVFLSAFIIADKTFPEKTLRITMRALISGLLLLVADAFNYYLEYKQDNSYLRLVVLAISFSSKISCSTFCVSISQRSNSRGRHILYTGMYINFVFSILSIFTGWIFYVEQDYSVGHGVLYFIPYAVILVNCIFLGISGIRNYKTNKGETVIIIAMIIASSVATYLEVVENFKLTLPTAYILCIIFYFMCLNVQLYRRDTLTHLLNRRSFFMDAKRNSRKRIHIISMDLNNLKYYNDTFGHAAGDKAILTATNCMNLAFSHHGIVYRTGGDEFMALFFNKENESVEDSIVTFKLLLNKTEYRVALGTSIYRPGDSFEDILAESDARMYKNKIAYKERAIKAAMEKNPELMAEE